MKLSGLAAIALALLIPLIWLPGIAEGRDTIALFSQYIGMMALIAMALAQVIATRWPGVEALFGPMDQSYRLHKWLGIGAMVAILLHDTIDAEMRGLGQETGLVETAETAGEISLYGLLIFVLITIATFIPYHLWKWTHRLIGIFFLLAAFHFLFILKPFGNGDPLGLYMMLFCGLGTLAYVYTSGPRGLRPGRAFRIEKVSPEAGGVAIEMSPEASPVRHRAGQFAFFAFTGAGYGEPHPFTISSAPREDGHLRVTIAPLGDLTSRLGKSVAAGQAVRVGGPYGRFGSRTAGRQVWIAAGVGITPFLALAESLPDDGAPVQLIYAVKSAETAAHMEEIKDISANNDRLGLTIWESRATGRLSASDIVAAAGGDLSGVKLLFCGPAAMRRSLSAALARYGVSSRNFHYEVFEIRTGLGLRRFAEWMWQRRQQQRN